MLIEAVNRPVRYRFRDGRELLFVPGHPHNLPEDKALKLLARTHGALRPTGHTTDLPTATPVAPILPGWIICWRDGHGRLKGGAACREEGTVATCRCIGLQWVVELTTGTRVPEVQIVGVASTNQAGAVTAAWSVRECGLRGSGQLGTEHAYHVGETVAVHSTDGSIWTGQVLVTQHEPPGQGTLPGHWYCVVHGTKQSWTHESLLRKTEGA